MNRILLIVGAIAVLIMIGAGISYISNQSSDSQGTRQKEASMTSSQNDSMMEKEETMSDPAASSDQDTMMAKGSYVPYSQTALESTAKTKRILFFYANWCPTCRPVNLELQENEAKLPQGVRVVRVNYNDTDTDEAEKELAKQYGITYQHTFILIDEDGKELKKWNGGGLDEIIAMTK